MLTSSEAHLNEYLKACGHEWIRTPMQREEVDPSLATIITMEIMGFSTVNFCYVLFYT